eukprot:7121469-Ditylum_brightwellii.AAC.1
MSLSGKSKKRRAQHSTMHRKEGVNGNLAEESKTTIRDSARHFAYPAAGFITGGEEIKQTCNVQKAKKKHTAIL